MTEQTGSGRALGGRRRRPAARIVAACALACAVAACGDSPSDETDAVEGAWRYDGAGGVQHYIHVAGDDVTTWDEVPGADCFVRVSYRVIEVDGPSFRLTSGADTFSIRLTRDAEDLTVSAFGASVKYARTTLDPATLPTCGVPNPGVACADLMPLPIGTASEFSLEGSDETDVEGRHHDLYRIDIAAATDLDIDMESSEIDSYLRLHDASGALLAWNDDASNLTLDARISAALQPGCHILVASSASPDEFGDYSLDISQP